MSDQSDPHDDNPLPEMPSTEESPDFANFDAVQYVAKHRESLNRRRPSEVEADNEVTRMDSGLKSGRGRRGLTGEPDIPQDVPVGLAARVMGGLTSGQGVNLYANILGQVIPLIRRFLPIVGCLLVLACTCVCGGGYLLIRLVSR